MNITYTAIVSTAVLFLLFTSSVSMADAIDKTAMDMPAMDDSMAMMMKLEPMMVNINTATSEEMFEALKGVGPMIAGAIIKHREANGRFFINHKMAGLTGTNGLAILLNYTSTHEDLGKLG